MTLDALVSVTFPLTEQNLMQVHERAVRSLFFPFFWGTLCFFSGSIVPAATRISYGWDYPSEPDPAANFTKFFWCLAP